LLDLARLNDLVMNRFEMDETGRLVGECGGGGVPRFLFGRSAEGCLWRFRDDLDRERVASLAKLAGRERAVARAGHDSRPASPIGAPPERLVMMARCLGREGRPAEFVREEIVSDGRRIAELWIFE
jgi:hypothetical protein